ncbi:MAG: TonB-dependent receptor [Woeseia sp.]|nr:TonB-dependent receptor [Woeseia sp.]
MKCLRAALLHFLFACGAIIAPIVNAAESYALPEIVVTGRELPASPIIERQVTSEDIVAWNSNTAAEALVHVPGVNVQYGGSSGDARAWMRGFRHRDVLILYDGIPIASAYEGNIDLNEISLDHVATVRVMKGAPSVIYGANGIGGVIDFIPKTDGKGQRLSLKLEAASNDTQHVTLGHAGNMGGTQYFITGNYDASAGFDLSNNFVPTENQPSGRRRNSDYERRNIFFQARNENTPLGDTAVFVNFADAERGLTPETIDPDYERLTLSQRKTIGISNHFDDMPISARIFYNSYEAALAIYDDAQYSVLDEVESTEDFSYGGAVYSTFAAGDQHMLVVSASAVRDQFKGEGALENTNRARLQTYTVSVEDQIAVGSNATAVAGLIYTRVDASQSGRKLNAMNPQFALGYQVGANVTLHASVAERTRFPKMEELYRSRRGNPDLVEQSALNMELGARVAHSTRWQSDFAFFRSNVDGLIERPNRSSTYMNLERITFQGVEAATSGWLSNKVFARLGYTHLDADEDLPGGGTRQLRSRARHSAYGDLRFILPSQIEVAINAIHSRGLHDLDGDGNHVRLPAYTVAQVKISKGFFDNTKVYISIANLNDENYLHRLGYPRPGRVARIGISASL